MGKALKPSVVTLPDRKEPYPSILDFLVEKFPRVNRELWIERFNSGDMVNMHDEPIAVDHPYIAQMKIYYYKSVPYEKEIPFKEEIIYQDDHILVACKPHFLPVTPSGEYVTQCLLYRLQESTGILDISPINRIDKDTAGLVLFSMNKESRDTYQNLFREKKIYKEYHAIAYRNQKKYFKGEQFSVQNRLISGEPWFRMAIDINGIPNSETRISIENIDSDHIHYKLNPITGKKHQLRVHLTSLDTPIINDVLYPSVTIPKKNDYSKPLQLLAKQLSFSDPLSNKKHTFISPRNLSL